MPSVVLRFIHNGMIFNLVIVCTAVMNDDERADYFLN